jgi:hypothetical protein
VATGQEKGLEKKSLVEKITELSPIQLYSTPNQKQSL